jgi:hypothetical protein
MLSKKSKIEQLPKSRESRFLAASAAASPCRTRTKLCDRLLVIRCGPSHWRAWDAPAALKKLVHLPEKPFSTASTHKRHSTSRYSITSSASASSAWGHDPSLWPHWWGLKSGRPAERGHQLIGSTSEWMLSVAGVNSSASASSGRRLPTGCRSVALPAFRRSASRKGRHMVAARTCMSLHP